MHPLPADCSAPTLPPAHRGPHPSLCWQGRDHTIFALVEGRVKFSYDRRKKRRYIAVETLEGASAAGQQQQQGAAL